LPTELRTHLNASHAAMATPVLFTYKTCLRWNICDDQPDGLRISFIIHVNGPFRETVDLRGLTSGFACDSSDTYCVRQNRIQTMGARGTSGSGALVHRNQNTGKVTKFAHQSPFIALIGT